MPLSALLVIAIGVTVRGVEKTRLCHLKRQRRYTEIPNNPADRIWLAPGAEHVSVYQKNRAAYMNRGAAFFTAHTP